MARLLATEQAALPPQGLEHVAVADVGGDDADAALRHEPVEAEIRHLRDRHELDAEIEREHREDRSPSTAWPRASTASMRSPSPSKASPGRQPSSGTTSWSARRSVAPQPTLMFDPSGWSPIATTSAPSCSNAFGAIAEYAPFAQSTAELQAGEVAPKRSHTWRT